MYYHILTSIVGSHPNIQDAFRFQEDDRRIIAVIADGLGSRQKSGDGARLICKLIVEELNGKSIPIKPEDIDSASKWLKMLIERHCKPDDFCTTCSFAVIDKLTKQVSIGQIGDSPIFLRVDNMSVYEMRSPKDFSNITDCLGSKNVPQFAINNYKFESSVNILVTSDGIGDELESSTLGSLFSYLSTKYEQFTPKSRSRRFTKELRSTIGKVNHDDKSAIYIWSK